MLDFVCVSDRDGKGGGSSAMKPLCFDSKDIVDVHVLSLAGVGFRTMQTKGGGACALHAVFGRVNTIEENLECDRPRQIVRRLLAPNLDEIRLQLRPHMRHLLDKVTLGLWYDFVVSFSLNTNIASEETCSLNAFVHQNIMTFYIGPEQIRA